MPVLRKAVKTSTYTYAIQEVFVIVKNHKYINIPTQYRKCLSLSKITSTSTYLRNTVSVCHCQESQVHQHTYAIQEVFVIVKNHKYINIPMQYSKCLSLSRITSTSTFLRKTVRVCQYQDR